MIDGEGVAGDGGGGAADDGGVAEVGGGVDVVEGVGGAGNGVVVGVLLLLLCKLVDCSSVFFSLGMSEVAFNGGTSETSGRTCVVLGVLGVPPPLDTVLKCLRLKLETRTVSFMEFINPSL